MLKASLKRWEERFAVSQLNMYRSLPLPQINTFHEAGIRGKALEGVKNGSIGGSENESRSSKTESGRHRKERGGRGYFRQGTDSDEIFSADEDDSLYQSLLFGGIIRSVARSLARSMDRRTLTRL